MTPAEEAHALVTAWEATIDYEGCESVPAANARLERMIVELLERERGEHRELARARDSLLAQRRNWQRLDAEMRALVADREARMAALRAERDTLRAELGRRKKKGGVG